MSSSSYNLLLYKLDEFVKKYYLNKLIKGIIYLSSVSLFLTFFLIITEYYSFFSPIIKKILLVLFILIISLISIIYVIKPILKYFKIGKHIDYENAAIIIGNHFPEVKDKLLNVLQLNKMSKETSDNNSLIIASIDQKINLLKPIPFSIVIKFSENKKYIKYTIIPFILFLLIYVIYPKIITDGSVRLINFNQHFSPPAPFEFILENEQDLKTIQNSDIKLTLHLKGDKIPNEAFIIRDNKIIKLKKTNASTFEYTLSNVQFSENFQFSANSFFSKQYTLNVLAKPTLLNFNISVTYPKYLNKKTDKIENIGDLVLPEGSKIVWNLISKNTDSLFFSFNNKISIANKIDDEKFEIKKVLKENTNYYIWNTNKFLNNNDSLRYFIQIIPDQYPNISISNIEHNNIGKQSIIIKGNINDDYGFSDLIFNYKINDIDSIFSEKITIEKNNNNQTFFYLFNINNTNIKEGDQLHYYLEVFDNDNINGYKGTKTTTYNIKPLSETEQSAVIQKDKQEVQNNLNEALKEADKLNTDIKKLNNKLVNKEQLSYEDKKQIHDLIERKEKLNNHIKELQNENQYINKQSEELSNQNEDILSKQRKLEDIFNNILDDKTKDILKNLQNMIDNNAKEMTQEELQKMQIDNNSLSKELDRMLELYKQLAFEQQLNDNINKLNELAEKQYNISKEEDINKAKLAQEEVINKFKELQNDMAKMQQLNQELEKPNKLDNTTDKENEINQDLQKNLDDLNNESDNKNDKNTKNQENTSKKIKDLANSMQNMKLEIQNDQVEIDKESLLQILENLISISFSQEKLISEFKTKQNTESDYNTLVQNQKKIKDDMIMVQDSLFSLSKRIIEIESFVNKEVDSINVNLDNVMKNLADRNIYYAISEQQYAMTSINNIAIMLSEILEQLENQQSGSGQGKGKSKKKNQSLSDLAKKQEELNKQMQEMKRGQKPGSTGSSSNNQSKEFAQMAMQQKALRNALQEISNQQKGSGTGDGNNLDKIIQDMERSETELFNKQLSDNMLNRQKSIETRLLEAEKAQKEQDNSENREAKKGSKNFEKYQKSIDDYNILKDRELEFLKTAPVELKLFYKSKNNYYFQKIYVIN